MLNTLAAIGFIVGVVALIKGNIIKLRIKNRKQALGILFVCFLILGSSGSKDATAESKAPVVPEVKISAPAPAPVATPAPAQKVANKDVVSKENYDKIKNGMTINQVKTVLGEPNLVSENEIDGLGKAELYHYQTGFSMTAIDVYFSNGKVNMKNWIKL